MKRFFLVGALGAFLALPIASGCGSSDAMSGGTGGAGGSGAGGSGVCNAPMQVFMGSNYICYACHEPGGTPPDLATPNVTGNSVSAQSTCMNMPFIDKTNRANSVLLKRVMGGTCGPMMPQTGGMLTATDMACLVDWVNHQP